MLVIEYDCIWPKILSLVLARKIDGKKILFYQSLTFQLMNHLYQNFSLHVNRAPFHFQDLVSNSPFCLPYDSDDVSLK